VTTVRDGSGTPLNQNKSAYGNPYMFTGRHYDDETDLYYYRARMHAPAIGRFLQPDPIGYADNRLIKGTRYLFGLWYLYFTEGQGRCLGKAEARQHYRDSVINERARDDIYWQQ
jgi:RHS repeat-associated protein